MSCADKTGEFCYKNQNDSDVWFLERAFGGKTKNTYTIPVEKRHLHHREFILWKGSTYY